MSYQNLRGNIPAVAQTTQKILNFTVGKLILQEIQFWQLSGRCLTLIWRAGDTVQNLESAGLSGRVESTGVAKSSNTLPLRVTKTESLNDFKDGLKSFLHLRAVSTFS